ncbi:MAG TPA: ATP-binding protein [Kofleriaceae bacterium]
MAGDAAYVKGMERLVQVVQELSMARDLDTITQIVRTAAREIGGADGATFVLRDHDKCFYADEDAISPLWKGLRFPIQNCISGWAMLHREHVVIEDIYKDARIPHDAYRPTFVKSLVMVPIRQIKPVGAIGNYWAHEHRPSETTIKLLQALADSTSTAMENVDLIENLERRVEERTSQLALANQELEAFSYAVSHDLRAPLRSVTAFSQMLYEDHPMTGEAAEHLGRIRGAAGRMGHLIDDLLQLSRVSRGPMQRTRVDLAVAAREITDQLAKTNPGRKVTIVIPDSLPVEADAGLVRALLENLLGNAWKFTARKDHARIEVGKTDGAFFVKDNGAGFDFGYAAKLFTPFQRLHDAADFEGTGIGLATVERIVRRHGGVIKGEGSVGAGATFTFTLS